MGELIVRCNGRRTDLLPSQTLGIGRAATKPGEPTGWGYGGRFLELGPDPTMHRIWAELAFRHGLWCIRSLGSRDRVGIKLPGKDVIELDPRRPEDAAQGVPADVFAVNAGRFEVLFACGARSYVLDCEQHAPEAVADTAPAPSIGADTASLGGQLASSTTETEYKVLWAMSRDYRLGAPSGGPPEPLGYARVARLLGHGSQLPAKKAVERLVRRWRTSGLLPEEIGAEAQRDWLCRMAVFHRAFDELRRTYGELDD